MKNAVPLVVLLSAAGFGAADAPRASAQHDTLPPVGVELVQIDAVVTDNQGRPVSGLTKADFEVREDGKAQELSVFSVEGRPEAEVMAAGTAVAPPEPPSRAALTAPPALKVRGRQIVIAVDDLHMAPTNLVSARAALLRFVDDQLATDDEVALVTTSGTVGLSQELTGDRTALRRAISRLNLLQERRAETDEVPHLTEYQAEQIDRGDPEAVRVAVQEILQANGDLDEQRAGLQAAQLARRMDELEQQIRDLRRSRRNVDELHRCERELHYDVLVSPTLTCDLPLVEEEETPEYRARMTSRVRPFNWLGWPSATTRDGVMFSGRSDATVLAAALAWERELPPVAIA
jgi:VWFA-related protein